ncbi:hypothetical protein [Roseomonas sp. BN140053]|uniref:hypothetical protein n=1 Tax=Roseomonas sp. BN140053 TaxID=3391898 RepID=UPI0039EA7582
MAAKKVAAPRPRAGPKPGPAALARIAELASKGAAPERVRRTVEDIVAGWLAGEDVDRGEVRDRLEEVAAQLAEGVEAAAEANDEIEPEQKAALAHAGKAMAAMVAARDAFTTAHGRL